MDGLEVGVQYHPRHEKVDLAELRRLTQVCADGGVDQVWLGDNLGRRHLLISLAALAPVKVKLGAAVMVQYFRSPLEAATALATITDLTERRELSVGIGRGNPGTSAKIEMARSVAFMREYVRVLQALWAGEEVDFSDFTLVAEYFRLVPGATARLGFSPQGPLRIYGGGSGPLGIRAAYELMDGLIYNGTLFLPHLLLDQVGRVLAGSAGEHPERSGFRRIAELKVSVHKDREVAYRFAAPSVAIRVRSLRLAGLDEAAFGRLGIGWDQVADIEAAVARGATDEGLASYVTPAMVDALFIAGTPDECRAKLTPVLESVRGHGFDQLLFSEIGPELTESVPYFVDRVLAEL